MADDDARNVLVVFERMMVGEADHTLMIRTGNSNRNREQPSARRLNSTVHGQWRSKHLGPPDASAIHVKKKKIKGNNIFPIKFFTGRTTHHGR